MHTTPETRDAPASGDAARLRRQYLDALSHFIARLSLPADALERVKARLSSSGSYTVEALLNQLALELESNRRRGEQAEPGDRGLIESVLLTLFDRLTLPPSAELDVRHQKDLLLSGIAAEELPRFVNGLAEIISQSMVVTQHEKQELEELIGYILGELRGLNEFLRGAREDLQQSQDNQATLHEEWDREAQSMAERLSAADDVEELRGAVQVQLQRMRDNMEDFRAREAERLRRCEERNARLDDKLQALQTEAGQLRDQLQENRTRLLKDAATGVPSRFAYQERMALEYVRWKRFAAPLSFLLWDIDFFKSINDTFGHKAGDRVLRLVAQLMENRIRASDFFARVGGEEFAMLLPGTRIEDAHRLADDIRRTVEETGFNHKGDPVPITVSGGLTEFRPGDTPDLVFERADTALLRAKRSGRNCCVAS